MSLMKESVTRAAQPKLAIRNRVATLETTDGVLVAFDVTRVDALDRGRAERVIRDLPDVGGPILVSFRTASPTARALLRERGISYAADDGEWFLLAPPVYVERPPVRAVLPPSTQARSPFATRASRVPRWLLLHLDARPSLTELANAVALSEPTVSRTTKALAASGLIELLEDESDSRIRRVRAKDTGALLESLERSRWLARARRQTWDIGAQDVAAALRHWRHSADKLGLRYAIGGPAGASIRDRVIEPADLLVWIREEDLPRWREDLIAETVRPSRGTVTVQLAPDPFIFELANDSDGLVIADPVQLYLDCRRAGERALEAAAAIREAMGW